MGAPTLGDVKPEIDRDELAEIVHEVARSEEVERELYADPEVAEVLRELDLPVERLAEAKRTVAERRAELSRRKRRRLLVALALAAVLGAGALLLWNWAAEQRALAAMQATQARLAERGAPVTAVRRETQPELSFEVSLSSAPKGNELDLTCDWKAPDGSLRYQNRWQTKAVDRELWQTHCRRRFGSGDVAGGWTVIMKQGERELASERFTLE